MSATAAPPDYDSQLVEKAMTQSEVQNQVEADIATLTANMKNVTERFRVVQDVLAEFDNVRPQTEPMAPSWAALRQRYLQNIAQSGDIASAITNDVEAYMTITEQLLERGPSFPKNMQEFGGGTNGISIVSKAARGKADEFEHLRTDVKTYQQQRLDNIDGFQATMRGLVGKQIEGIVDCLGSFHHFWAALVVDCQAIEVYMDQIQDKVTTMKHDSTTKASPILIHHLKSLTTLFQGLVKSLSRYAKGVREAGDY